MNDLFRLDIHFGELELWTFLFHQSSVDSGVDGYDGHHDDVDRGDANGYDDASWAFQRDLRIASHIQITYHYRRNFHR